MNYRCDIATYLIVVKQHFYYKEIIIIENTLQNLKYLIKYIGFN